MYTMDCKDPNCTECRQTTQASAVSKPASLCDLKNTTKNTKTAKEMAALNTIVERAQQDKTLCLQASKKVKDVIRFEINALIEVLRKRERDLLEEVENCYLNQMSIIDGQASSDCIKALLNQELSNKKVLSSLSPSVFNDFEKEVITKQLESFGHLSFEDIRDSEKVVSVESTLKASPEDSEFLKTSTPYHIFKFGSKQPSRAEINKEKIKNLHKKIEASCRVMKICDPEISEEALRRHPREDQKHNQDSTKSPTDIQSKMANFAERLKEFKRLNGLSHPDPIEIPDHLKMGEIHVDEKDNSPVEIGYSSDFDCELKRLKEKYLDSKHQKKMCKYFEEGIAFPDVKMMKERKVMNEVSGDIVIVDVRSVNTMNEVPDVKMMKEIPIAKVAKDVPDVVCISSDDDDDLEIISTSEAASIPAELPPSPPFKVKKRSLFKKRMCFSPGMLKIDKKHLPTPPSSTKSESPAVSESESFGEYNKCSTVPKSVENSSGNNYERGGAPSSDKQGAQGSDEKALDPSEALLSTFLKYLKQESAQNEWLASVKSTEQFLPSVNSGVSDAQFKQWLIGKEMEKVADSWLYKAHKK